MSGLDLAVIAVNCALAFAAAAANVWAATRADPRFRPLFGAVGALALVYTVGYVWLLICRDVEPWSKLFRGVSPLAWLAPWCSFPIAAVRTFRADRRKLDQVTP